MQPTKHEMTFQAICDKTGPEIAKQNTKICDAVPVPKRVAIVLWRLATGQLETPSVAAPGRTQLISLDPFRT